MLKYQEIEILITRRNITHFRNLNYPVICNQLLKVKTADLTNGSDAIITAICEICGDEHKLTYHKYLKNVEKCGYYGCKSCSYKKRIILNQKKYGVNHTSQLDSVKKKTRQTCLDTYGVPTTLMDKNTQEKIFQTNIRVYGYKYPIQNQKIFDINQKTQLKIKIHDKTGLSYQGTYEKDFLDYCYVNNIEASKIKPINYVFENVNRTYHPDFYLKKYNLVIEIKSDYYYYKYSFYSKS